MCARRSSALFVSSSLPLTSVSLSLTRSFVCLSLHIIGQLAVFKGKVGKNTLHSVQSVHIFPSVHRSGVRFFASVLKITVDCRFFFRSKYFYPRKTLCPLNLFKKIFNFQLNFKNREVRQVKSFLVFLKNK